METEDIMEAAIGGNNFNDKLQQMRQIVSSVIIGQQNSVDLLLTAIVAEGHIMLEGVPGVAKTLSARLVAKLINSKFSRVQFTSDLMPSDVLGTNVFNVSTGKFEMHHGPIFADIVLADEINRAPAKTQSALFEVMEERQATIDGNVYPMSNVYTIIATQNPIDQEGTYRLPEAQMDRFIFKIVVGYPSPEAELEVLKSHNAKHNFTRLEDVSPILTPEDIIQMRQMAHEIHVDEKIMNYIVSITQATRSHSSIHVGASPRASLAFLRASKAYALLNGRSFVIPDDVKMLAMPILCHRLSLTAEAEMDGESIASVITDILEKVEVPK